LGNPRDNDCKGTFLLLIFENYPLWFWNHLSVA
jgi:hypothetical protein